MRRCIGASHLRDATSELDPLTAAQLSAPSSIRGCPMSTRPGPKRGLASSLRVHARSIRAQRPCDARATRATTRTAPSCGWAGLSYRACPRWWPRPFPALDGGRAPVTRVRKLAHGVFFNMQRVVLVDLHILRVSFAREAGRWSGPPSAATCRCAYSPAGGDPRVHSCDMRLQLPPSPPARRQEQELLAAL